MSVAKPVPTDLKFVDVAEILRMSCVSKGGQKAWADYAGVSQQYVNDVLKGRRDPGNSILQPLGLERIVTYRRIA